MGKKRRHTRQLSRQDIGSSQDSVPFCKKSGGLTDPQLHRLAILLERFPNADPNQLILEGHIDSDDGANAYMLRERRPVEPNTNSFLDHDPDEVEAIVQDMAPNLEKAKRNSNGTVKDSFKSTAASSNVDKNTDDSEGDVTTKALLKQLSHFLSQPNVNFDVTRKDASKLPSANSSASAPSAAMTQPSSNAAGKINEAAIKPFKTEQSVTVMNNVPVESPMSSGDINNFLRGILGTLTNLNKDSNGPAEHNVNNSCSTEETAGSSFASAAASSNDWSVQVNLERLDKTSNVSRQKIESAVPAVNFFNKAIPAEERGSTTSGSAIASSNVREVIDVEEVRKARLAALDLNNEPQRKAYTASVAVENTGGKIKCHSYAEACSDGGKDAFQAPVSGFMNLAEQGKFASVAPVRESDSPGVVRGSGSHTLGRGRGTWKEKTDLPLTKFLFENTADAEPKKKAGFSNFNKKLKQANTDKNVSLEESPDENPVDEVDQYLKRITKNAEAVGEVPAKNSHEQFGAIPKKPLPSSEGAPSPSHVPVRLIIDVKAIDEKHFLVEVVDNSSGVTPGQYVLFPASDFQKYMEWQQRGKGSTSPSTCAGNPQDFDQAKKKLHDFLPILFMGSNQQYAGSNSNNVESMDTSDPPQLAQESNITGDDLISFFDQQTSAASTTPIGGNLQGKSLSTPPHKSNESSVSLKANSSTQPDSAAVKAAIKELKVLTSASKKNSQETPSAMVLPDPNAVEAAALVMTLSNFASQRNIANTSSVNALPNSTAFKATAETSLVHEKKNASFNTPPNKDNLSIHSVDEGGLSFGAECAVAPIATKLPLNVVQNFAATCETLPPSLPSTNHESLQGKRNHNSTEDINVQPPPALVESVLTKIKAMLDNPEPSDVLLNALKEAFLKLGTSNSEDSKLPTTPKENQQSLEGDSESSAASGVNVQHRAGAIDSILKSPKAVTVRKDDLSLFQDNNELVSHLDAVETAAVNQKPDPKATEAALKKELEELKQLALKITAREASVEEFKRLKELAGKESPCATGKDPPKLLKYPREDCIDKTLEEKFKEMFEDNVYPVRGSSVPNSSDARMKRSTSEVVGRPCAEGPSSQRHNEMKRAASEVMSRSNVTTCAPSPSRGSGENISNFDSNLSSMYSKSNIWQEGVHADFFTSSSVNAGGRQQGNDAVEPMSEAHPKPKPVTLSSFKWANKNKPTPASAGMQSPMSGAAERQSEIHADFMPPSLSRPSEASLPEQPFRKSIFKWSNKKPKQNDDNNAGRSANESPIDEMPPTIDAFGSGLSTKKGVPSGIHINQFTWANKNKPGLRSDGYNETKVANESPVEAYKNNLDLGGASSAVDFVQNISGRDDGQPTVTDPSRAPIRLSNFKWKNKIKTFPSEKTYQQYSVTIEDDREKVLAAESWDCRQLLPSSVIPKLTLLNPAAVGEETPEKRAIDKVMEDQLLMLEQAFPDCENAFLKEKVEKGNGNSEFLQNIIESEILPLLQFCKEEKAQKEQFEILSQRFPSLGPSFMRKKCEEFKGDKVKLHDFIKKQEKEEKMMKQFQLLVDTFPSHDPDFLQRKCQQFEGDEELLARFTADENKRISKELAVEEQYDRLIRLFPSHNPERLREECSRFQGDETMFQEFVDQETTKEQIKLLIEDQYERLLRLFPSHNPELLREECLSWKGDEALFDEFVAQENERARKVLVMEEQYQRLRGMFPEAHPEFLRDECYNCQGNEQQLLELIQRKKFESVFSVAMNVLVDVDPAYIEEIWEASRGDVNEFNNQIMNALEGNNYRKIDVEAPETLALSNMWSRYVRHFNLEEYLRRVPNPEEFLGDAGDNNQTEKKIIFKFLASRYPEVSQSEFNKYYSKKKNLSRFCKALDKLYAPNPNVDESLMKEDLAERFLQEVAFITHRLPIMDCVKQEKQLHAYKIKKAEEEQTLMECKCCFDQTLLYEDGVICTNEHLFCKSCVQRYCEVNLGDGQTSVKCMTECNGKFSYAALETALPVQLYQKLLLKQQMAEIKEANLVGLESCPSCDYSYIPPPTDLLFRCMNEDCKKESCRLCKEASHIPLRCQEVERPKDLVARQKIEETMTEALVRRCYKCDKKFIKVDGCNKMTCACGAIMCYLCRKPVIDYNHFNGQGGTHFSRCPLWSNNDDLHVQPVQQAGREARDKALQENPDLHIVYDPTL